MCLKTLLSGCRKTWYSCCRWSYKQLSVCLLLISTFFPHFSLSLSSTLHVTWCIKLNESALWAVQNRNVKRTGASAICRMCTAGGFLLLFFLLCLNAHEPGAKEKETIFALKLNLFFYSKIFFGSHCVLGSFVIWIYWKNAERDSRLSWTVADWPRFIQSFSFLSFTELTETWRKTLIQRPRQP